MALKDEARAEIEMLDEDIFWTEKSHFAAAGDGRALNFALGGIATIGAALATVGFVTSSFPVVAGISAGTATLASALVTFVRPTAEAQKHSAAAKALNALRVKLRQYLLFDFADEVEDPERWRTVLAELAADKAAIDGPAPHVSNFAMWRAGRRIRARKFAHGEEKEGVSGLPAARLDERTGRSEAKVRHLSTDAKNAGDLSGGHSFAGGGQDKRSGK